MTTRSLTLPFLGDRPAVLPARRTATERFIIGVLTLTLLLSFLQYCLERSDIVRLVPVGLLIGGAFVFLLMCPREKRRIVLATVICPGTLAIISAVCVPPLLSSLYRPTSYALEYGIALVVTLIAVRILLSGAGLEGLLFSFFYATTAGMLIVTGLSFADLLTSVGSTRYAPMYFDPNRIGFFAVTAIPAQLWFVVRRRRYSVLLVSLLSVLVALGASSRGSIGALLAGGMVAALLYIVKLVGHSQFVVSKRQLILMLGLVIAIGAIVVMRQPAVGSAGQYIWIKLELDTRARGLDSGFTGRTGAWAALLETLPKTSWFWGNGYRTTDEDFPFAVDNGYLSSVYEIGLFSTLVVLTKFGFFIYLASVVFLSDRSVSGICLLAFVGTLVIFLSNAFVERVLLGCGEQASILVLFAFMATQQDVLNAVRATPSPLDVRRPA